jgi:CRP-like cAMP-binding protein
MAQHFANPLEALCENLARYEYLEPKARAALADLRFELRALPVAAAAMTDGTAVSTCSLLLSGMVYRSKTVSNGERQILAVHVPGELLDLQNLLIDIADHDVRMLTEGELAIFSRRALIDIAFQFPSIGIALWRESLVEQSIYREWLTNIGRRDALARVAHLICEFCCRLEHTQYGIGHGFELPMSQEQIGDCVGLTSVHVNRMLKRLETMHLIARTRRSIQIADWHALQDVGDFSPDYLHCSLSEAA